MLRLLKRSLPGLATMLAVSSATAFSLVGPFAQDFTGAVWQVPRIGYNSLGGDMGGVLVLGEEYRWNVKTVTYGFDSSFRNYFGQRGMDEVRKAIAILNALPPASQMSSNLGEFPLEARREHYQASALLLLDLKSHALGMLVNQMGLANPERYTWTLRARATRPGPIADYTVVKRNFDPVTWSPVSHVNGTLYTYGIFEFANPDWADAIEFPVDPLQTTYTSVAAAGDPSLLDGGVLLPGEYITGLTRDDAGGLRYLYSSTNYNIENLLPGSTASGGAAGSPVDPSATNFVGAAIRQGIEKITFVEARYESELGNFITITNRYTDTYVTNSRALKQSVQRVLVQPDILFAAEDLGVVADSPPIPILVRRSATTAWINNDALNGQSTLTGPGIIPQALISFSTVGPYFVNSDEAPGFLTEFEPYILGGFAWGSFDGTTNPPVVYPNSISIQELEQQVLGN